MFDKNWRLKLKLSQVKIELNYKIRQIKKMNRELDRKNNTIIRLNNIIRNLKRNSINLPIADSLAAVCNHVIPPFIDVQN